VKKRKGILASEKTIGEYERKRFIVQLAIRFD